MNRIVKRISLVGLLMLAVVAGASAQSSQQYRADIPFSFDANGKHYEAGEYAVGPLSQVSVPGAIALRDLKNGNDRILGITAMAGENNWNEPGKITFVKQGGRYTLSTIATATFRMKMKVERTRSELAKSSSSNSETVAIDLKK